MENFRPVRIMFPSKVIGTLAAHKCIRSALVARDPALYGRGEVLDSSNASNICQILGGGSLAYHFDPAIVKH